MPSPKGSEQRKKHNLDGIQARRADQLEIAIALDVRSKKTGKPSFSAIETEMLNAYRKGKHSAMITLFEEWIEKLRDKKDSP